MYSSLNYGSKVKEIESRKLSARVTGKEKSIAMNELRDIS
jgi:hypothetical protein